MSEVQLSFRHLIVNTPPPLPIRMSEHRRRVSSIPDDAWNFNMPSNIDSPISTFSSDSLDIPGLVSMDDTNFNLLPLTPNNGIFKGIYIDKLPPLVPIKNKTKKNIRNKITYVLKKVDNLPVTNGKWFVRSRSSVQ